MARFPAARGREAPSQAVPFLEVPFLEVPFLEVPFLEVPFLEVPFLEVPFLEVPFLEVPFLEVLALEVLALEVSVRVASVLALTVRAGLVREVALQGPVRGDRARALRMGVHRRTAGLARPGSPDLRHQAGLRRCASTRRPGRASRRRTDVTGPVRRSHRVR